MSRFDYFKPQTLNEAWELKERLPGARFIAGGTDLMVKIKNREASPSALISLRAVPELCGIEIGKKVRIGAATTIGDLIRHPQLANIFPVLIQAAKRIGSVQVRNVGTIGGNLCNCSPCADAALALLVLDGRAVLKSPQKRREVPLKEFFIAAGESCLAANEVLSEILLERPNADTRAVFLKKGRVQLDLAVASAAVLLEMDANTCKRARLAAGSAAPVPLRLERVERLLEDAEISKEVLDEAQEIARESISPIDDVRASADYRRQVVGIYVRRAVEELLGWTGAKP